ncbi:MAG: CpaD family pilus assembly lipoprotein [Polyangiaceae bacterium]
MIAAPSGSPNEVAAMQAVAEIRYLLHEYGFSDASITVEAYHERPRSAAGRSAFPICAMWPKARVRHTGRPMSPTRRTISTIRTSAARTQHNFAAQVANPADLLGPRTMTPASGERRDVSLGKIC